MLAIETIRNQTAAGSEFIFGFKLYSVKSKNQTVNPDFLAKKHQMDLSSFINLLYDPERNITYCLRYIITPDQQNYSMGKIEVAFLVKAPLSGTDSQVREDVNYLSSILRPVLGSSFNEYSWKEINDIVELKEFIFPIDWKQGHFAEIRRREEVIYLGKLLPQRHVGFMQGNADGDEALKPINYIHPYTIPMQGFPRILKTLLQSPNKTILTTLLKPTVLLDIEKESFSNQISYCEGSTLNEDSVLRIHRIRANILSQTLLSQYLTLQDAPFYMTFTVASESKLDRINLEMIGLGITDPIGQTGSQDNFALHNGGYDVVVPKSETEQSVLMNNMGSLSQNLWPIEDAEKEVPRLRYLFDGKEAVSAFYLPINNEENLPGIRTHYMEEQALPQEMVEPVRNKDGSILIGRNHFLGFEQELMISESTRRQHTYIIGQTGTGKTTLMKTMILSDMKAGNGLAVIDPHGELYEDLLALIPENRKDDVVLFDPSDTQFPVGFNLLEVKAEDEREAVIKEMRAILKRYVFEYYSITDGGYAGPVFFQHIQNNLLLATSDISNPGTIVEATNIFLKPGFYKRWLPLKWENHVLHEWVRHNLPNIDYQAFSRDGGMYGDYFSGKLTDFTNDPRVSLIFGQPYSTVNIADIIENKKILLINLSKGLLGEASASLLGMILMAKFSTAFMERRKFLEEGKNLTPFYLYVDEFQNIATENFSILLSEARKFGLGLILANQFISQVREKNIREAIFGNVGTLISFRLGIDDARIMESQFLPHFDFQDICNLPNYNAIIRTNIEGRRTTPCNFHTILPEYSDQYSDKKEIVNISRQKYSIPKELAEYLVEVSLAPERLSAVNLYFEKDAISPEEKILNCDLSLPLSVLSQGPEEYNALLEDLFFKVKAQIIFFFYYQDSLPAHKVVEIHKRMKDTSCEDFHKDKIGFLQAAADYEPDILHKCIGIANSVINDAIVSRIQDLSQSVRSQEELELVREIVELMSDGDWKRAFGIIGSNTSFFKALQERDNRFD
jgi:hypothetical protein